MNWENHPVDLVGKKVLKILVNECNLIFDTDCGRFIYGVGSDCCSESWFSEVLNAKSLIGQVVRKITEPNLDSYNVEDGRGYQDYDSVYGFNLVTDLGECLVCFRNSSNGYYGGYLIKMDEIDEHCYNRKTDNVIEISGNWVALGNKKEE